ncbi:hypothetical protein RDWZM_008385 [Blomia tropicalis]|uniref:Cuticle protein 14 n=1 Tax=Blomia tropicalis TaxID=40697 RepID=A0A9Q0M1Z9_BLOTA|nr:hypothetical protein RDWZM_008385 [Blomia tropicalis]
MKFFVAVSVALFASAYAIPAGIVNTGASAVSRSDDGYGNYAFGYNEDHATGGTFRKEKGGPGVQVGSYGLRDADGRIRTVNYVADALGFRASVQTNEPGVDPHQAPAAASVNGAVAAVPAVLAPEPLVAHAPLAHAPLAHAPLAHAPLDYAPLAHAPLAHAPLAHAPLDYAPLAHAPLAHAPLAHAPLVHAPLAAIPTAFSVATQHVSAGPILASGPIGYGKLGY